MQQINRFQILKSEAPMKTYWVVLKHYEKYKVACHFSVNLHHVSAKFLRKDTASLPTDHRRLSFGSRTTCVM